MFLQVCETTDVEECVDVPGPEVCETVYDEECSKVPFEDCKVMNGMSYCVILTVNCHINCHPPPLS